MARPADYNHYRFARRGAHNENARDCAIGHAHPANETAFKLVVKVG